MLSNSYFFQKISLQKITQRLRTLPSNLYNFRRLGTPLQTVMRLSYTSLLSAHPVSQFRHFRFLSYSSSSFPLTKSLVRAKPGHGFWSSILRYLGPIKTFSFKKFLITSLHLVCGLGPPIKNTGYAYGAKYAARCGDSGWRKTCTETPKTGAYSVNLVIDNRKVLGSPAGIKWKYTYFSLALYSLIGNAMTILRRELDSTVTSF